MSEWEDRINSILGDPAQMEQIAALAQSLMGGEEPEPTPNADRDGAMDPALLAKLSRLMQAGTAEDRREQALLKAMKPYLSAPRQNKLARAMELSRMARIARLALSEMGENKDV